MRDRLITWIGGASIFLVLGVTTTFADVIMDQVSEPTSFATSDWTFLNDWKYWEQTITAGECGQLMSIDIWISGTQDVYFWVYEGTPDTTQTNLTGWDYLTPTPNQWWSIDVTTAGIFLEVGDEFGFGLEQSGEPTNAFRTTSSPAYAAGDVFLNGSLYLSQRWDALFRTYMDTSQCNPVPEPATLSLLGIGLVGLIGGAARRKLKKKAIAKT